MLITTQNRRRSHRVQAQCPVWFRNSNGTFSKARLIDLSETGAALQSGNASLEEDIHMVVRLKPGSYLNLKASKVWETPDRVGLKFSEPANHIVRFLGTQVTTHLARFITKRRCTVPRALLRRERTVPRGMARMSATS